ncbi:hypothetical protein [Polaromonas sp. JS666]|uniref:hypothetical protein n=1 Tax=Polaromonas sp. (strain JS666 / ATCC BAA-500) TaxID=296591 RepID=UPI0000463F6C|nr:hypothetical protein [Polaromonas sp. JS666]ABE42918.1 hypothetical protein Bpro_0962 [Polaromonas sp. JS666]
MSGTQYPDKAFATQQARAAIAGVSLHRLEDDRGREVFIVSRWAMTRELPSLDAVSAWLDAVTGKTA